eukprot:2331267-Amphidinium_carterae.1
MSSTRTVSPLALTGDSESSDRRSTAAKRGTTYLSSTLLDYSCGGAANPCNGRTAIARTTCSA